MLSFLTKPLPRTQTASQNPLVTDDGATSTEFLVPEHPHDGFCVRQTLSKEKVAKLRAAGQESVIIPPYHWHSHQTEYFVVEKGTLLVTIDGKQQAFTKQNGMLTIKPGLYHTFAFDTSLDEDLVIKVWAEPEEGATDQFFRNLFSYLDDCRKAKRRPNIFQLLLFLHSGETYMVLPKLPKSIGKFISRWILGYVCGKVIGEKLLGFKDNYPEYMAPSTKKEK